MPPLQFTLCLPILGGAYFGKIVCFKAKSKIKQMKFYCRIIAVVLFPSLYYMTSLRLPLVALGPAPVHDACKGSLQLVRDMDILGLGEDKNMKIKIKNKNNENNNKTSGWRL